MYYQTFVSNFKFLQILKNVGSFKTTKHQNFHIMFFLWNFQHSIRFIIAYFCIKHHTVKKLLQFDFLTFHMFNSGLTDPYIYLFNGIFIILFSYLYYNVHYKNNVFLWNCLERTIITSATQYYSKNSQLDLQFNIKNLFLYILKIKTIFTVKLIKFLYLTNVIQKLVCTKKIMSSGNWILFLWVFFEFELQYLYLCKI